MNALCANNFQTNQMHTIIELGSKSFPGTISVDDDEKLFELAKTGIYLELDLFGIEVSLYQANEPFAMPSDSQRIQMINKLFDNGYDKVVIAHDIHTKHRLVRHSTSFCFFFSFLLAIVLNAFEPFMFRSPTGNVRRSRLHAHSEAHRAHDENPRIHAGEDR